MAIIVYVWPKRRVLVAAQTATILLLLGESVVVPVHINMVGPIIGALLIGFAFVLDRERPPKGVVLWVTLALASVAVTATALHQPLDVTAKLGGVVLLWVAAVSAGMSFASRASARVYLQFIVTVGTLIALFAVVETLLPVDALREIAFANAEGEYIVRANTILGSWVNRAQVTFGYPIPLALFLAMSLVIALISTELRLTLRLSIVCVVGLALILTGTRSAFVAVAAGIVVYFVSRLTSIRRDRPTPSEWLPAALFAVAAGMLALIALRNSLVSQDFSLAHRLGMLRGVWDTAADRSFIGIVLGEGRGSVEIAVTSGALDADGHQAMDNTYAFVFYAYGAVGLLLLVALIAIALWKGSHPERTAIATLAAGFLFIDGVEWHALAFLFFLLIGVGGTTSASVRATEGKVLTRKHSLLLTGVLCTAIAIIVGLSLAFGPLGELVTAGIVLPRGG